MIKSRGAKGTKGRRSGPIGDEADRLAVQETFLNGFIETATITGGCTAANISRNSHYDWLKNYPDYREAFHAAEEILADVLEVEARRRAVDGVEEPVGWYQGEPGGTVTKYSDGLLRFLLEGRRASVFKNRHELTGAGGGPLLITQIERVIVDPDAEEESDAALTG